jgi:hypothetical protein
LEDGHFPLAIAMELIRIRPLSHICHLPFHLFSVANLSIVIDHSIANGANIQDSTTGNAFPELSTMVRKLAVQTSVPSMSQSIPVPKCYLFGISTRNF